MATSKSVTKKKVAKKRPSTKTGTKSEAKRNVKTSPVVESNQAQPMSGQQTAVETSQVGSGVGRNIVSWIALLFSGLAVGGVVWYSTVVENVGQQEIRFNTRVNIIAQRVAAFDAAQSDNNDAIGQLQNQFAQGQDDFGSQIKTIQNEFVAQKLATKQAINTQADDFRQQLNMLSDAMAKLRAEQGRDMDSRTLEQAEQLIFIAKQRAQFGGQFAGVSSLAIRALQDADVLLQKLADPALNQIRQSLTREITALDEVKVVDIVGVLNELAALSSTADNLVLAGDIVIAETPRAMADTDSERAGAVQSEAASDVSSMDRYMQPISDAFASFLSSMSDLIQVEKNGKSVKSIISVAVRQMTYQKTQLLLSSAQIAFIRQQSELYQNRIQATRSWIAENFAQDTDETVRWLARLDAVGLISPQAEMPDISESLKAIREFIKNRNPRPVGVELNQAE